ncbi:MAG: RdgB/HAM1 family non-canonical purine NTP pyrophosphatase [Bacilli bacterium]|nr:RdgB/HAM1 family non-canonical purine NTP pyrophosphatase [Bacilli bacterium]
MNFEIVLATTNQHKVEEYRTLLSKHGITLYSFKDLNLTLPKVKENGKTFAENATIKALAAAKIVNMPVMADDSGLCLKAYKGFPGLKTARFVTECGNQVKANQKIIEMLKGKDRSATFHCVIVLVNLAKTPLVFEGIAEGSIAKDYDVNEVGFGYDPIFIAKSDGETFFHLGSKRKNEISHRAKACKKLVTTLKVNNLI